MELEHSFTIPVPAERAWQALLDVEQIAPCMPGATVESVTDDVISGRIKVKVGPVMLTYSGKARFTERDDQAHTVTLEASGKETRGSGTASATVRSSLLDEGGQTRVVVQTSMTVTGRPAQFGRGVMVEVGGKIIERFAANLAALLAGGREAGQVSANGAGPGAAPGPAAPAAALAQPVQELNLPVRAFNSLRREGIHTVADLTARTEADLLGIENLGPQSVSEIKQKLASLGLALATVPGPAAPGGAGAEAGTGAEEAGAGGAAAEARAGAAPAPPSGTAAPARAVRPPDEEAIDLLSVAGFPVLKRALPAAGAVVAVALLYLRLRHRRRRGGAGA